MMDAKKTVEFVGTPFILAYGIRLPYSPRVPPAAIYTSHGRPDGCYAGPVTNRPCTPPATQRIARPNSIKRTTHTFLFDQLTASPPSPLTPRLSYLLPTPYKTPTPLL